MKKAKQGNSRKQTFKDKLRKIFNFKFLFFALCLIVAIILGLCILLSYLIYGTLEWDEIFIDIIKIGFSTVIITVPLGLCAKIITDKYFSVEVNMKRLRKLGINGVDGNMINGGTLSGKDEEIMFGPYKSEYPKLIKLMFMTGKAFLKNYQEKIITCLNMGCQIQILLASPDESNLEYFQRDADVHRPDDEDVDYFKEITEQSLIALNYIKSNCDHPENLKLRFYRDEFQNNLRISRYFTNNGDVSYFWLNVQPLRKCALVLSVSLKGTLTENDASEKNLFYESEEGFNYLWEKYKDTEWKDNQYVCPLLIQNQKTTE